jgi:hypothetical protein
MICKVFTKLALDRQSAISYNNMASNSASGMSTHLISNQLAMEVPAILRSTGQEADMPSAEPASFRSLPRELRDIIYGLVSNLPKVQIGDAPGFRWKIFQTSDGSRPPFTDVFGLDFALLSSGLY